ncbi:hypothetical protein OLS43_09950, partial [Campylobacter jejuni]|nr:hypothetical protein [Campylobacter jejuni]
FKIRLLSLLWIIRSYLCWFENTWEMYVASSPSPTLEANFEKFESPVYTFSAKPMRAISKKLYHFHLGYHYL